MTIQQKLYNHYKMVIEEVKQLPQDTYIEDIKNLLKDKGCINGVCYCMEHVFDRDGYNLDWINKNTPAESMHWFRIPAKSYTKEEILESLEYRLNILSKYI